MMAPQEPEAHTIPSMITRHVLSSGDSIELAKATTDEVYVILKGKALIRYGPEEETLREARAKTGDVVSIKRGELRQIINAWKRDLAFVCITVKGSQPEDSQSTTEQRLREKGYWPTQ